MDIDNAVLDAIGADQLDDKTPSSAAVASTPKLSKKERKALLASNKSFEKSLKNVVSNPFPTFWPYVDDMDELYRLSAGPLERCSIQRVKLPLSAIKGKSKEEKQEARKQALSGICSDEARRIRSMLAIGVNAVSRALEKNEVEAVLIAADVQPKLMAQHLITLAAKQAAVIVAPGLRLHMKQTFGVETSALAFKTCTKESSNEFHLAVLEVQRLAATVTMPDHLQPQEPETSLDPETTIDSEEEDVKKWQDKQVQNWHLKRPASGKAAFYPSGGNMSAMKTVQEGEFISLSQGDEAMAEVDEDITYLPLRVKRVKPNKDKVKKKKLKTSKQ